MLKWISKVMVILCLCTMITFVFGCQSSVDYRKEGKYQEAYDKATDEKIKQEILKENKLAIIIKNCSAIKNLPQDQDITTIANYTPMSFILTSGSGIEYIFSINKKQTLGEGYYQDHYYFFNGTGALVGEIFESECDDLRSDSDADVYDMCKLIDKAFGTDWKNKYMFNKSTFANNSTSWAMDAGSLAKFSIDNNKKENQMIVDNLNELIHSGKINNVTLIKNN